MPVASHLVRFEKMCRFASIFTQSNIKLLKNHTIQKNAGYSCGINIVNNINERNLIFCDFLKYQLFCGSIFK